MIQSRSLSRELALLWLGQISEDQRKISKEISLDEVLNRAIDTLMQHFREKLDGCALELETAQQYLLDSELQDVDSNSIAEVRKSLRLCLIGTETILNNLSSSLELPRLLYVSDQKEIRLDAMKRVSLVVKEFLKIDSDLDSVMEGWRLKRLPRIDRDILRLAFVDLMFLKIPAAVACNEAVELANRYSDEQGRRMINGVLRRLQNSLLLSEK